MKKSERKITKEILTQLRGESAQERLLHRLHSVTLVLKGYSASESSRIYGDSPRAVAYWVTRFKQDGTEGLKEESRPGRPSRLSDTQLEKLQTFIRQSKEKMQPVNADMLAAHILKEFKIRLTPRQCWRILKRLKS